MKASSGLRFAASFFHNWKHVQKNGLLRLTQNIIITLSLSTISYKPLNLYRQFKSAAQEFPNVTIYFDQPYASFAELGLENTYQTVFEAI